MRTITYFILVLLFVCLSCTNQLEKNAVANYTPPIIEYQPRFLYPKTAQENFYYGNSKVVMSINNQGIVKKAEIINSSGYSVLDSAAIDYCMNLIFKPAMRGNKPSSAKVEWEIKFNFSEKDMFSGQYISKMKKLLNKVETAQPAEKKQLIEEILINHDKFIQQVSDASSFNSTIAKILMPEIVTQWSKEWNSWPLSFLLYFDFIKRFPDFENINEVKKKLAAALDYDIKYIKSTHPDNLYSKSEKEKILWKIKSFLNENYPEYQLNIFNRGALINSELVSR
jgi:TonB family protein